MRVFVTGATGFIGSRVVPELINAGHQVIGLKSGAAKSDGVIHLAFDHNFADFVAICEKDRRAIEAMGSVLAGSDRPFVITSGTGMGNAAPGQLASEEYFDREHPNPRKASELAGDAELQRGVNVSVVRLPQVHDTVKQGLISYAIPVAREKGVSAYIGDGANRWPAAHVSDVARLYKLAFEKGKAGARYNAVAEEGISFREIAEAIGRGLKVPVVSKTQAEAAEHFGWMAAFTSFDMPASSALTQKWLGWKPTGPGLIADLDKMDYSKS